MPTPTPTSTPTLWSKDFLKGSLANFFLLLNLFLLMVVISAYAMERLDASPSQGGFATGIFIIGALISRLFSGQLIDRMGRKKMVFTGTSLSLAMTILYLVSNKLWILCVVRFFHGVGYGIASVAIVTVVVNILPDARKGEGIGYYMMGTVIASAIGPFLAMAFLPRGGFSQIFFVGVIFALLSIGSAFTLSFPVIDVRHERSDETKGSKSFNFFESTAIPISIVCALLYLAYSSIISFLSPYAHEIQLVDSAGFFFIVFSVAILLSRPLTGRVFDLKGENYVIYPVFPLFGIGFIILSQTGHTITLLIASVFLGLGFGIVQACGMATALKGTPSHRVGFASSTFYVFVDLGVGLGPFMVGLCIPYLGYRGMYMSMAAFSVACIFVYHLLHGRKACAAA